MGHPSRDIFSAALALPEAERLELASHLIASVDGPDEPEWETAWVEEVERREARPREAGPREAGAPWSEVRERTLDRLARR